MLVPHTHGPSRELSGRWGAVCGGCPHRFHYTQDFTRIESGSRTQRETQALPALECELFQSRAFCVSPQGQTCLEDREACVNEHCAVGSDAAGPGQGTSARSEEQRQAMTHLPFLQKLVYCPKVRAELLVLPTLAAFSAA